jgi:hypothetical protein
MAERGEHVFAVGGGRHLLEDVLVLGDPPVLEAEDVEDGKAADMAGLIEGLGFEKAAVAGHDRGARVAHRRSTSSTRFPTPPQAERPPPASGPWNTSTNRCP